MTFTPLSSFCNDVSFVTSAAFLLSLPDTPESVGSRDDFYLDACIVLNALRDSGKIDDIFFDYLCMHLDYSHANGGV